MAIDVRIKSVKLENFKSHVDTYISFSQGLNLVIGPNGSGKSSVLQAIGLAFFGIKNNLNLSNFITNDGENRNAVIKIDFVSGDDMNYTISKTILNNGNSKVRLTCENGLTIDSLPRINDLVKQIFQIKWGEPEKIYKNVITAYQNDITDIFAQTDAKRNEFFNTLFNTEIYKTISATHMKNYETTLKDQSSDLKNEKSYLESDISKEKSVDEEIEKNEMEIEEIEDEFHILETKKSKNEEIISKQTRLEQILKDLDSQMNMMKVKIGIYQKQLLKLEKDRDESKTASKNVAKSKADYVRYNELSEKIKEKNSALFDMKKRFNEFHAKDDIGKKNVEIEKIKVSIEADMARISENEELSKIKDKSISSISSHREKMENFDLKALKERYESSSQIIKLLNVAIGEKHYTQISDFFDGEDKKIFDDISMKIKNPEALQKALLEINEIITETNTKIKELRSAKSTLSDGTCPYLKMQCLNIKGDPSGYFDPKINALGQKLSDLKEGKSGIEDQIKKNEILIKEQTKLTDKLNKQKEQTNREIYNDMTKKESDIESEKRQVEDLEREKIDLSKSIETLQSGISKKMLDIKSLNDEIEKLKLKMSEELELKSKIDELEIKINAEQDEMQHVKAGYDLYNQNNAIASKLDEINVEIENAIVQKTAIEQDLERISPEIQKHKSLYDEDELKRARSDLEKINEQISTNRQRRGELNGLLKGKLESKKEIEKKKEKLLIINSSIKRIDTKLSIASNFRNLLNDMGSKISIVYRNLISSKATDKYDLLSGNSDVVKWGENYDLHLISPSSESMPGRSFEMLSGGEQISLALSMRMAMAIFFSKAKFALFDEPTVNLDVERRNALSESLPELLNDMEQVIVVTHDDTFKEMTEKIIVLKKFDGKTTVEK